MADAVEAAPAAAFQFGVNLDAHPGVDTSFAEVSGIAAEMQTEDVHEGGENRFVHALPKGVKHPPLELKRAIAVKDSVLVQWCKSTLESGLALAVQPKSLTVKLLDAAGQPLRAWSFANAFPVKWEVEPFSATKNELAIEKIVLHYTYSARLL